MLACETILLSYSSQNEREGHIGLWSPETTDSLMKFSFIILLCKIDLFDLITACALKKNKKKKRKFEICFYLFRFLWIVIPSACCRFGVCGFYSDGPQSNHSVQCRLLSNSLDSKDFPFLGCSLRVGSIFALTEIGP